MSGARLRAPGPGLPAAPLLAAAVVAGIVAVGVALPPRHGALLPVRVAPAPVQSERTLRFDERDDGTLMVFDAADGVRLAMLPQQRNGFLHAVVHGLGVGRRRAGVPLDAPYRLTLLRDGRLLLRDPPTGTAIDVEGFGPTNMAGILAFLAPEDAAR